MWSLDKKESVSFYEIANKKKSRKESSLEYRADRAIERFVLSLREKQYKRSLLRTFTQGYAHKEFHTIGRTRAFDSWKALEEHLIQMAKEHFEYACAMKNGLTVCIFYEGEGYTFLREFHGKNVSFRVKVDPQADCEQILASKGTGFRHVHIMEPGENT